MFSGKSKIKLLVIILSIFIIMPAKAMAAGKIKVGVVNLDKAGRESKRGKKIVESMKLRIAKEQDIIKKKEQRVKELRKELNKQGLIMSEDLKRKKESDYRMEYRSMERHIKDAQEEIQIRQRTATKKIIRELVEIVKEIGEKEDYTYIVTNESVIYNNKAVDITDKVIKEYNKKYRK